MVPLRLGFGAAGGGVLSVGLVLMAIHQAYFIAPNWSNGATWEAFRHVVGALSLLVAAAGAFASPTLLYKHVPSAVVVVALLLAIETVIVATIAGILAWPTLIFLTWTAGVALLGVSLFLWPNESTVTLGLVGPLLIGFAFVMFLIRHLATPQIGVIVALGVGIAGALLVAVAGWRAAHEVSGA